jgi:16S rRNA A1518/A1519 N6-dimethyltransferase RsmA/KsgA/DIM1 with predicted DNA glycosylase/AP lyase activity
MVLDATSDPDGYFGERAAATYDESTAAMSTPEVINPILDFLVPLAAGDAALEFGVGTGRIALPLAARGINVHGIELSRAMSAKLTEKPGAGDIRVTIGDFATTRADGSFGVVYLVFNTIMNLTSQDAQVACFKNAAAHL